jgi:hypothetical protein
MRRWALPGSGSWDPRIPHTLKWAVQTSSNSCDVFPRNKCTEEEEEEEDLMCDADACIHRVRVRVVQSR